MHSADLLVDFIEAESFCKYTLAFKIVGMVKKKYIYICMLSKLTEGHNMPIHQNIYFTLRPYFTKMTFELMSFYFAT